MDKGRMTEKELPDEKHIHLEDLCRKLKSDNESLKIEVEVLNATIIHYENSFFHKLRETYTKFKTRFMKKITLTKSSESKLVTFFKISLKFIITAMKFIFKKVWFFIYRKEFHLRKNDGFNRWRAMNMPKESDLKFYRNYASTLQYKPLISILMPVYNPPVKYLKMAIESVLEQIYGNWELCISDDNSSDPEIRELLEVYRIQDNRIKVTYRDTNGHISINSNSALALANGEFIALLDHDDLLTTDALFQIVYELNLDPSHDFIYSDEDKMDEYGNFTEPHFKPSYCPDNLLSRNYITHLACIRHSIVKAVGGFRTGFEGSQDYDLFLRITEITSKVHHIPRILYHWRLHAGSASQGNDAKPYAYLAGKNALAETIAKRGEPGEILTDDKLPGYYSVRYKLNHNGKISIIIPTKDKADILKTCIDSIFKRSTYQNFEVILLDNNSMEKSLFDLAEVYKAKFPTQFKFIKCDYPFNYSKLMNDGVAHAEGEYILLLNNDTEVITPNWMELMMAQAQRKSIGCVGVKLLFFNNTIQHAGVIMGLGGLAGHSFFKEQRNDHGYCGYLKADSNYSAVTAACLLVRKSVFLEVNGFDESIAVEYNDVDFCLKVKEKGYNNIFLSKVEMYHYESLSRGSPLLNNETMKRHVREVNIIKSRWNAYIMNDPCYSPNLTLHSSDFKIRLNP